MRTLTTTLTLLGLLTACTGDSVTPDGSDDTDVVSTDPTCDPPSATTCDNPYASLRGTVRLGADAPEGSRQGRLLILLAHEWLGQGAVGGVPHIGADLGEVDLDAGPIDFELDMCAGGSMWSEENCSYQLIAVIDTNGNQTSSNMVPDAGELAGRIASLDVSCHAETECLDLVIDCAGPDCVRFEDKTTACACDPDSCNSEYVTCR